jgi:ribosomal-protein-alanine N-acetyltransferase
MSAVLKTRSASDRFTAMHLQDLDAVLAIEQVVFTHPWTRGNFADSIAAGYHCRLLRDAQALIGYFVLSVAVGEGHLLNLSVSPTLQRRGYGNELLEEVLRTAKCLGATRLFLEVRPSNHAGRALYQQAGFHRIAVRPAYYPAYGGREDALILERML